MLDAAPHTRLDDLATARQLYARRGKAGRGPASGSDDTPPCYSIRSHRWACVYTHPQAEIWADTNLRRGGYPTYLPLYATTVSDRATPTIRHVVHRPLFARYLFLLFDHLSESWSPIRATPGVADLIRAGSEVAYASEAAIEALRASEGVRRFLPPSNTQWAPGTPCSLAVGPFAGLPAVVTAQHNDEATITVMFLGHLRNVLVPLDCLKAREE
jgi:transcriptional antiterminator RfaH